VKLSGGDLLASTRPDPNEGLTDAQVNERVAAGLVNVAPDARSRSLGDIVKANTFTWFNGLIGTLWLIMIWVAPPQDALFGLVIVFNTGIGIIQEYRASRELAKLTVLGAVRPTVLRNGSDESVAIEDVVRDDIIVLSAGDQIVVDGEVLTSAGLEIDESLLTGEAEPVHKAAGDEAMSGSFVVAGSGVMLAQRVGADSFAAGLTAAAKEFSPTNSELRDAVAKFIRFVSYLIVPIGILLVISQLRADQDLPDAIRGSIAGMVTMIPEGLVLLTSIAMAVAVVRLAQRKALVQEMPAVEALARTDVVCVDKTGTLTDPGMALRVVSPLAGRSPDSIRTILGAVAASDPRPNPTMDAVRTACPDPGWQVQDAVPFSSARKWSAASFSEHGDFVIGAPEVLVADLPGKDWWSAAEREAAAGSRVLLLGQLSAPATAADDLPAMTEIAVVVIDQVLRSDAAETVAFFERQDVAVKVISGDNAATVGAIAERAGVAGANNPADARSLPDRTADLAEAMDQHSVFGRVSPEQKQSMVGALQEHGHTVTMTGDGVNDVLALKRADLGIAMGSGAPASRAVAQIVLLNNKWSTLPDIVHEGRRVLGNIERVSDVFLTKSIYAMSISLATGLFGVAFPFLPRQLTLVASLTIGIPGFFLALMPNSDRFRPGFFRRVLLFAVPAGLITAVCAFTTYLIASDRYDESEARTYTTVALFLVALAVLLQSARPLNLLRLMVVASMAALFLAVLVVPALSQFFAMEIEDPHGLSLALVAGGIGAAVILLVSPLIERVRTS
jgi:cation-transporting ATPase E